MHINLCFGHPYYMHPKPINVKFALEYAGGIKNNVSNLVFQKLCKKILRGFMHTANGWHSDVQPESTSARLVFFVLTTCTHCLFYVL